MDGCINPPDEVVVKRFVTTAAGNAGGTTLVCSSLTSWPNLDGSSVKILTGSCKGQSRAISGSTTGGTVTVAEAFCGQIASGVRFSIIGLPSTAVDVAAINAKIGTNADAAGTTTVFARLRQIVDTYLADGTIGLNALRVLINAVGAAVSAVNVIVTAIKAKTDLINSATGSGTLNDANPSATIIPTLLPTKMNLTISINNLNNNGDDFDIEVKVGPSGSEETEYWVNLTSDGSDISADSGNGVSIVIKQRRIDISNITVHASEQVVITLTKNSATDRDVAYKYSCGV